MVVSGKYTREEIGHKIGKDRATVTNKIRLLKLDPRVKVMLLSGQISLAGNTQYLLAQQCSQNEWSIRRLQKEIKKLQRINRLPRNVLVDANISSLENRLSELFGTKVKINHDLHRKRGGIIIGYASLEILEGLLDKWGTLK